MKPAGIQTRAMGDRIGQDRNARQCGQKWGPADGVVRGHPDMLGLES